MSDTTPNLALPYLQPAQAQKHVTHNEALQLIDAAAQLVLTGAANTPPPDPLEGDCFIVLNEAGGDWVGSDGRIAVRQDGAWLFLAPRAGWRAHDRLSGRAKVYLDGAWHDEALPLEGTVAMLGINATADGYNRLAVSAPASLFTHAGGSHRLTINKQNPADTASLVLQSGWQGRAEIGLAGTDSLSIKVSGDGADWVTALAIAPDGLVDMPARPGVRAALSVGVFAPAPASQTGFDTLTAAHGGFSLGATLGAGLGNRLIVPATGLYLATLRLKIVSATSYAIGLLRNGGQVLMAAAGESVTTGDSKSLVGLVELDAGDLLTLTHSGNATLDFAAADTELSLVRL